MKVVDEAFQLFGGAGTSREYPIEKLFRDARVALIEDGENYDPDHASRHPRAAALRRGLVAELTARQSQHTPRKNSEERTPWPSTPSSSTAPAATPAC
ncbi:MAG: hypothetical protein MZU91_12180 [Desulfosudis oleivorans]|nr:hypothetical protein [Desulfosudis oleivorans]